MALSPDSPQSLPSNPLGVSSNPVTTAATLPSLAALVIDSAVRLGMTHWVISPGSRSAPLTVALAQRDDIITYVIYDERSAGHVALGLAQQFRTPVGLVCTSGTAALNLAPALAEAYYQGVSLIAITADRPPEWIDQQDNQALRQDRVFGQHVRAAYTLPVDDAHADTRWHAVRMVSDAWQIAAGPTPGPVHINIALREPLYARSLAPVPRPAQVARALATTPILAADAWERLLATFGGSERVLVIGGPNAPDPALNSALQTLGDRNGVAVIGDITANLQTNSARCRRWEAAIAASDDATLAALRPDLVISFGGAVTARNLKALLRGRPPRHFWRIGTSRPAPDTYQALTDVIPLRPVDFFRELVARSADLAVTSRDYAQTWREAEAQASAALDGLLDSSPFGEFAAVRSLMAAIPPGANVQVGNSMPIRYANILGLEPGHLPAGVYANRGVSGIDGCVSTAVGAALARPDALTLLVVGDLAFFYDRNGLWHRHLPPNLRIALLNNHGGGIFDIIDGPDSLPEPIRREFFLTPQPLTAERTAADLGLEYARAASAATLAAALPEFMAPSIRPRILEIETDMATNSAIFRRYRDCMSALALARRSRTSIDGDIS